MIGGKSYVLEHPIVGDVALIKAERGDRPLHPSHGFVLQENANCCSGTWRCGGAGIVTEPADLGRQEASMNQGLLLLWWTLLDLIE